MPATFILIACTLKQTLIKFDHYKLYYLLIKSAKKIEQEEAFWVIWLVFMSFLFHFTVHDFNLLNCAKMGNKKDFQLNVKVF